MSPSNTMKNYQMSNMVVKGHAATKDMAEATSTVDTVGFSTTVADIMEPSTSTSMNTVRLSTTTILDTKALSIQVKDYLKSNQIKWGKFSTPP